MPKIIIQTEGRTPTVTLSERVVPTHTQSDHYAEQLIQRVGWALLDAETLEADEALQPIALASHRRRRTVNPRLGVLAVPRG
jgi:hypothetical protein